MGARMATSRTFPITSNLLLLTNVASGRAAATSETLGMPKRSKIALTHHVDPNWSARPPAAPQAPWRPRLLQAPAQVPTPLALPPPLPLPAAALIRTRTRIPLHLGPLLPLLPLPHRVTVVPPPCASHRPTELVSLPPVSSHSLASLCKTAILTAKWDFGV